MDDTSIQPSVSAEAEHVSDDEPVAHDELVEDELLVEEISIDGMCGVY